MSPVDRQGGEARRETYRTCPIREHTADGAYVGRCDFGVFHGVCPRHGVIADYPTLDDREVDPADRRMGASDV